MPLIPCVMHEQIAVFIQMGNLLIVHCDFYQVASTWTAPRVMHYRTNRNHFYILQRDPVILYFLSSTIDVKETEFNGF